MAGCALLTVLPRDGNLVNQWAADHTDAVAGGIPIMALDMYEHAYHMDYGAAAAAYVDAFMANIEWARVYKRYQVAVHGASESLAASHDDLPAAQVLDVRRAGVFGKAGAVIAGAAWRDPAAVADWARDVPKDKEIVVYCVYGHEVGRQRRCGCARKVVGRAFSVGESMPGKPRGRPVDAKGAAS